MTINLKFYSILSAVISSIGLSLCESQCMAQVNNSTVKNFEIEKFVGKWYELARYDHFFERGMTNVTADYTLLDDGKIRVVNSGIKNGRKKEIVGKAKYPEPVPKSRILIPDSTCMHLNICSKCISSFVCLL